MVSRRSFLKAIAGGALALSAGGIALLDAEPIVRTYFLPPRCGWNAGSWELACATEALRIVSERLGIPVSHPLAAPIQIEGHASWNMKQIESLHARRARLIERVDKLARGWTPTRTVQLCHLGQVVIHGGRSRG
jgi:anaerobic selenocysteine-containing dehydrogenase